jgi:hypothetical protein
MITENIDIIWTILGIITIVLLIIFWRKRNAVWGGLTIGIIIGFIVTVFYLFKESGFDWFIIGKGAILGTILGFIAELLGKIFNFVRKREQ